MDDLIELVGGGEYDGEQFPNLGYPPHILIPYPRHLVMVSDLDPEPDPPHVARFQRREGDRTRYDFVGLEDAPTP
jgi:hypothetical protein